MTKKLRMAIDELERELSVITQAELAQLMGGYDNGNSSGLSAGSSIDDVVNYFTNIGFEFTQDSSGNYFLGAIQIQEVSVMGYTTTSGYDYGGSGDMFSGDMFSHDGYAQSYLTLFQNHGYYPPGYEGSSGNNGGGTRDPLPNGDCLFNMIAYLQDEHYDNVLYYKNQIMARYTFSATIINGNPAYHYNPDDVVTYLQGINPGKHVYEATNPSFSTLKAFSNLNNSIGGITYNNHAYKFMGLNEATQTVTLLDTSKPNDPLIQVPASAIERLFGIFEDY